jgi:hypothetical protein
MREKEEKKTKGIEKIGGIMIEYNPLTMRLDSSKISDYMRCPRYFFFRHVLGWRQDGANHDLEFGSAWHLAMEYLLAHGFSGGWVDKAMEFFMSHYRKHFSDITDLDRYPKSPAGAREALELFEQKHKEFWRYTPVIIEDRPATEVYGTVPISDTRKLHFKIDGILQNEYKQFLFMDHKTTGSDNPVYTRVHTISNQMSTYYHALVCLVGNIDQVYGGVVNVSIFRKKGHDHNMIPIKKTHAMLNEWLVNVNNWYTLIEADVEHTFANIEEETNANAMSTFKRCDHGCTAYYKLCPFFDMCTTWNNPLQRCSECPSGFTREFWDPDDAAKEGMNVNI